MNLNIKELDSEELYKYIKDQIKKHNNYTSLIKKTISQDYTYTQEEIYCSKKCISFDNNNLNKWVSASFESRLNDKNFLSPEIKGRWGTGVMTQKRQGIDISNLIFRSNEDINYKIVNNTLKSTVTLKGESEYWIFLHSKESFSDETIVILLSKIEFSETVFMSLGLFIKNCDDENIDNNENQNEENNKNNNFCFRIFHTLQLIRTYNSKDTNSYKYENSDSCVIKLLVVDEGKENINVSAWINEGDAENTLSGNFCKQVSLKNNNEKEMHTSSSFELNNNNYKVMIAGSGQLCKVTHFSCETNFKENLDFVNGCKNGYNSCNCCIII